jgi:hypothetical protein
VEIVIRKVLLCVVALIAVAGTTVLSCRVVLEVLGSVAPHVEVPEPSEITTPLDADVVRDICSSLGLGEECPQCQPGEVVYAPDLFPWIRRSFPEGVATREEVDSKLGVYRYECEEPVETNFGWRTLMLVTCHYDLRGDRVYPFAFTFTDKDVVYDLMFGGPGS